MQKYVHTKVWDVLSCITLSAEVCLADYMSTDKHLQGIETHIHGRVLWEYLVKIPQELYHLLRSLYYVRQRSPVSGVLNIPQEVREDIPLKTYTRTPFQPVGQL